MTTVSESVRQQESSRLRAAYNRARLKKRITQGDIAVACGWQNQSSAHRLMNGKLALTPESLAAIAELLDVPASSISPRLANLDTATFAAKHALGLPVSTVAAVARGNFGTPMLTAAFLPFLTSDEAAYALTFDADTSPLPVVGMVAVVEPSAAASVGDYVLVKQGTGRFCFGLITGIEAAAGFNVAVDGKGAILAKARQCSPVTAFCSRSLLQT